MDGSDFGIWNAHKFTTPTLPSVNYSLVELGDATGDGVVDGSDFGVWNAYKFTSRLSWPDESEQFGFGGEGPSAPWLCAYNELLDLHSIFLQGQMNNTLSLEDWESFSDAFMALLGTF